VTATATAQQKRVALIIAAVTFLAFLAAVPFVRVPLMRMPAFIPSYEAALLFIDLVTAVLLLEQFMRLRAASVLVLAAGYLFDALIIIPHALSFPGAFAPTGLLGAREQTTAWLYVFWHGGFPLFVLGYALLRHGEETGRPDWPIVRPTRALAIAVLAVAAIVAAFTAWAKLGHDYLPVVMQGSDYSLLVKKGISPMVWLLTLIAMAALWQRHQRVIDLWLMLVMWIWLFDIALAAVIGSSRFDLGFYAGRIFGLLAASFLLITLVVQMARMYVNAIGVAAEAQKKLAELALIQAHPNIKPMRGERSEAFIQPPEHRALPFIAANRKTRRRAPRRGGKAASRGRDQPQKICRAERRRRRRRLPSPPLIAAPALLPHPLADGAGNARLLRRGRNDTRLRLPAGDLQHQLGARRFDEFLALADRDDESPRPANHAIFVIDVEVLDIHGTGHRPLEHDRQSVNGDSGGQHIVACRHDQRTGIVGAVARHVDDPAQAAIAAGVEQRLGESERASNRGARRAPVGRSGNLGGDGVGGFGSLYQPPGDEDLLVVLPSPFEIGNGDLAVGAFAQRQHEFARGERLDVALALQRLLFRVH
jgi:membrane-associated sensor protein